MQKPVLFFNVILYRSFNQLYLINLHFASHLYFSLEYHLMILTTILIKLLIEFFDTFKHNLIILVIYLFNN